MEFFKNYPYKYYFTSIIRFFKRILHPFSTPPAIAFYFGDKHTALLLKHHQKLVHWDPFLQDLMEAPTLEITHPHHIPSAPHHSSPYYKAIYNHFQLFHQNPTTVILDDGNLICRLPDKNKGFKTIGDMLQSLTQNPVTLLGHVWTTQQTNEPYLFQILSTKLEPLNPDANAADYPTVIVCGYPERKAQALTQWADLNNHHLMRVIPLSLAIIHWTLANAPQGPLLLMVHHKTSYELIVVQNNEIRSYQATNTQFEPAYIKSITDRLNSLNSDVSTIDFWLSGTFPEAANNALRNTFKNHKYLTTETLRHIQPIEEPTSHAPDRLLWLLNHFCEA